MKKITVLLTMILLLLATGCGSKEGQVNVIKGAGNANSSLMAGLSELCPGNAEGFAGNSNSLIVSEASGMNLKLSLVDISKKQPVKLLSLTSDGSYSLEASRDGSKLICNNTLVDLKDGKSTYLPPSSALGPQKVYGNGFLSSYSFIGQSEHVLTFPYFYIYKYAAIHPEPAKQSFISQSGAIYLLGDTGVYPRTAVQDVVTMPRLIAEELKYIFIGYKPSSADQKLYSFDLITRKLSLLDSGVKSYSLSPDNKTICYMKRLQTEAPSDMLLTVSISGEGKKELDTLPVIEGAAWSSNGSWLAYSAGERSKADIHIIKPDGTSKERLTQGMNTASKLAFMGNRLAFTSKAADGSPKVYTILLNVEDSSLPSLSPSSQKQAAYAKLLEILRSETQKALNGRDKV